MTRHASFAETRGVWFDLAESVIPALRVGGTPAQVVHQHEVLGFKLLNYSPSKKRRRKMLIVPHIINRPYILDLHPDVSVVRRFCEAGFDVYMIDWGYPGPEHATISFRDYSNYVNEAVNYMSTNKVRILGYCTGGIIGLIFASLHPDRVSHLVLLATPVDFSMSEDPRISLVRTSDLRIFAAISGNIPGEFINSFGSYLLALYIPVFSKNEEFQMELSDRMYSSETWRVARWLWDAPEVPSQAYSEFINGCYRQNLFIKGEFRVGPEAISLNKVICPLLNIAARFDHLIPVESVTALQQVYSGSSYRQIVFPSSHIGMSVSQKAHKELWPVVSKWLKT